MDKKPPQHLQQLHMNSQMRMASSPHNNKEDGALGLSPLSMHLPGEMDINTQIQKKKLSAQRKQRKFIPDDKKDDTYWSRRCRNNEAARRSREKRRINDMILENQIMELTKENYILKAQLQAIKDTHGIMGEDLVNIDKIIASMPKSEQICNVNKQSDFKPNRMDYSPTNARSPERCISSPTPSSTYHPMDAPESPHNYSQCSAQSNHDNNFDEASDQYHQSSTHTMYYSSSDPSSAERPSNSYSPLSPATSQIEYLPATESEIAYRYSNNENGSSIPHKLRHKYHMGDKDAVQSLLALRGIKSESHFYPQDIAEDSVGSSDERDSGISYSSNSSCDSQRSSDNKPYMLTNRIINLNIIGKEQPTSEMQHSYPYEHQQDPYRQPLDHPQPHQQQQHHQQQQQHQQQLPQQQQQQLQNQYQRQQQEHHQEHIYKTEEAPEKENVDLRLELERIASEVATLKYMLVRRPKSDGDSDTSR